jgi:hypothetical protein
MTHTVVLNIFSPSLIIVSISLGCSFLNNNHTLPSLFMHFLTIWNDNSVKRLNKFVSITVVNISAMN